MTDEEIQKAVDDGILTAEQAVQLKQRRGAAPAPIDAEPVSPDEERFRFLGGFNDIFVTLGLFLLIGALYGFSDSYGSIQAFAVLSAVIALGLSEIFARIFRLALPGIILALMFTGAVWLALVSTFDVSNDILSVAAQGRFGIFIAIGTALAASFHLWRYRVPINGLLIAAALLSGFLAAFILIFGLGAFMDYYLYALLVFGIAVFVAALSLDSSDPNRVTRRSDIAFWLHLLAAPLIIHPIARQLVGDDWNLTFFKAGVILFGFIALSIVALVIDRRALLVSTLSYAGAAVTFLIGKISTMGNTAPPTLLALAFIVLFLSIGWHRLRRFVLLALPQGKWRTALPPVRA